MKRITLIAALAGAGVLGAVGYSFWPQGDAALVRKLTVFKPAPTTPFWAARVTLLAGDGQDGVLDGAAAQSRFSDPYGIAVDARGTIYIADGGASNRIRRIDAAGNVSSFVGASEGYADGIGAAAAFHTPSALAFDRAGNLYVADTGNHAIRKITPDGSVSTLAGDGQAGDSDGQGRAARFRSPVGLAVGKDGNVYVADTYNDRIRRITPDGSVSTLAGGAGPGHADGLAGAATFDTPSAIVLDQDGTLFVADTGNDAIRRIGTDGVVTTIVAPLEDERKPLLRRPTALALTHDHHLYIGSAGGRILQLPPNGQLGALDDADHPPEARYGSDGKVHLHAPRGMVVERAGSLLVADAQALRVLRLAPPAAGVAAPQIALPKRPQVAAPMPWPVAPQGAPHEVVGLMGEVRGSYDGESRDHFHAGLDVRADVGAAVLAIQNAKVSDPFPNWDFGGLGEGFSVGPLAYLHMRVGRDMRNQALDARFQVLNNEQGKPARVRIARGTRFAVGDRLGSINSMAHVHLNYAPGGSMVNAMTLPFPGMADTIAPRIQNVALYDASGLPLKAAKGQPLRLARTLGAVSIVVDAYDQMDGNLARRRLGLYQLGYQLLHADGSAVAGFEQPLITQVYDRLPREPEAVKLLYAENSGITVYGSAVTRFNYILSNTLKNGRAAAGSWQIDGIAPGDYLLRIHAADYAGQVALAGRDVPIAIE